MKYFFSLAVLFLSNFVLAEGRIEIGTEDQNGVRWLDLYGENIPASYGMEMELIYSKQDFFLVDTDNLKAGPQIKKGSFFSESSYEIANNVDVKTGRIRYAVSLLKPAEPVMGSGHLARIGLVSKTQKNSNIEIVNIKFGTQSGKVVDVSYPASVLVEPALSIAAELASNGYQPVERQPVQQSVDASNVETSRIDNTVFIIGLLSIIGILLLVVIILLLRRRPIQAI